MGKVEKPQNQKESSLLDWTLLREHYMKMKKIM